MLDAVEAYVLVWDFFNRDFGKTRLWFQMGNPLLGGLSPRLMVDLGRGARLLEFVKAQILDNQMPVDLSSGQSK